MLSIAAKLHVHIISECVPILFTKNYQTVHACRNYSLPKFAHFFETQCISGLYVANGFTSSRLK